MRLPPVLAYKNTSNVFYLAPLAVALYENLLLTAVLVSAVVIFGLLYHFSHEKKFGLPDSIAAYLLIASNMWLCYIGHFKFPYFLDSFVIRMPGVFLPLLFATNR